MTGHIPLDWAMMSLSLFNAMLLLWLGLIVLLTAERRGLGMWLLDAGLFLGAGFFISHTAILGTGLDLFTSSLDFWWRVGWLPIIVVPLAWYSVLLWFAGFWAPTGEKLRRRHRPWFALAVLTMLVLLITLYAGNGLPTFGEVSRLELSGVFTIGGWPVVLVAYPIYLVGCIVLAVTTLREPTQSERFMGDIAVERTRPWLLAASLILLAVSLLVGWFMLWAVNNAEGFAGPTLRLILATGWFDIVIQLLIALVVICIGQAIVSYEIFTGHSLPRRAFFRLWRNMIIVASGYALLIGGSVTLGLNLIYSLLLGTVLMVAFYALDGWRSFVYRDRFIQQLRPFVGSQNLIEQLRTDRDTESKVDHVFQALCEEVLNTANAQIVTIGSMRSLVDRQIIFPLDEQPVTMSSIDLANSDVPLIALDASVGVYRWGIPLWAARGPIGVLLLGDKSDGGIYTREEVEIARATGERILDMLAAGETSQRLLAQQRRRLAETQVLDRQTRRALHDNVLPDLHTIILGISAGVDQAKSIEALTQLHRRISDLIHTHPGLRFDDRITDLVVSLKAMVAKELASSFTSVTWKGEDSLSGLDSLAQEVLFQAVREAIRNAALHGRGDQPQCDLHLCVTIDTTSDVTIRIEDDGVGLKRLPSSDTGGLTLHRTMLALLGGTMIVLDEAKEGTTVQINLPALAIEETDHL